MVLADGLDRQPFFLCGDQHRHPVDSLHCGKTFPFHGYGGHCLFPLDVCQAGCFCGLVAMDGLALPFSVAGGVFSAADRLFFRLSHVAIDWIAFGRASWLRPVDRAHLLLIPLLFHERDGESWFKRRPA